MDRISERRTVMIVLRVVGLLTVFLGVILLTRTLLQGMAAYSATSHMPAHMRTIRGPVRTVNGWACAMQLSVVAWGLVLCWSAGPLAGLVTGHDPRGPEPQQASDAGMSPAQ